MKILIAGSGISGLTSAISLALRGEEVELLEQSQTPQEYGGGLQLSANGCKILESLGVLDQLTTLSFSPDHIEMRIGSSGKLVFQLEIKRTSVDRWGAPYIHIHRGDLIEALMSRLNELSPNSLKLNSRLQSYEHTDKGVIAHLSSGEKLHCDILIAGDGIRSTVRQQMHPTHQNRFTGYTAWRSQVPLTKLSGDSVPKSACVWVGNKSHAVTTRVKGGDIVNFVGITSQQDWQEEDWKIEGTQQEALNDFTNWHPLIGNILENSNNLYRWAIFDHAPLPHWSDSNVVLIGDAAHPILPSMAQGAVMAIEDGYILAQLLNEHGANPTTLKLFETTRKNRIETVRRLSSSNLNLFHHCTPFGIATRYLPLWIISRIAPTLLHRRHDKIYNYFFRG